MFYQGFFGARAFTLCARSRHHPVVGWTSSQSTHATSSVQLLLLPLSSTSPPSLPAGVDVFLRIPPFLLVSASSSALPPAPVPPRPLPSRPYVPLTPPSPSCVSLLLSPLRCRRHCLPIIPPSSFPPSRPPPPPPPSNSVSPQGVVLAHPRCGSSLLSLPPSPPSPHPTLPPSPFRLAPSRGIPECRGSFPIRRRHLPASSRLLSAGLVGGLTCCSRGSSASQSGALFFCSAVVGRPETCFAVAGGSVSCCAVGNPCNLSECIFEESPIARSSACAPCRALGSTAVALDNGASRGGQISWLRRRRAAHFFHTNLCFHTF